MAVYVIAMIEVTDDGWIPAYAENVHPIVHKHGGKYLSRSGSITTVEGDATSANIMAILEFPSMDAVVAFASDPEYLPYGEARRQGSKSTFHVIDDTDAAGTIPYLEKG